MTKQQVDFTVKEHGFCGSYYNGTKHTDKAIIYMSGAGVGRKMTVSTGKFLINEGYNVLVLGFYKWKGLPKEMHSIPVEYVENAIRWLKSEASIEKVGLMGTSTDAGYTLLCASLLTELDLIIASSPFDYVMEGPTSTFKRAHKSFYTWQGKDYPYTETTVLDAGVFSVLKKARKDPAYGLSRGMRYLYDQVEYKNPDARIKVENSRADILLLASENDDMWPADVAIRRIECILKENIYSHRFEAIIYEKGSHAIGSDWKFNPIVWWAIKQIIPTEKIYPKECKAAREDSMKQIIKFIEAWN